MSGAQSSGERPPRWEYGQSLARVGRLARKELAEILCDRRTILTLVLMPLLLYTLLSFAFRQFLMAFVTSTAPGRELRIGVETAEQKRLVEAYLAFGAEVPCWRAVGIVGLQTPSPGPGPFLAASSSLAGRFRHEPHIVLPGYEPDPSNRRRHPPVAIEVMKSPRKVLSYGEIDAALRMPGASFEALPALGRSAAGLGSPQGPGPLLAASALFPAFSPLELLIKGDRPLILDWDLRYLQHAPRSREVVAYLEQHVALANARQVQTTLDKHGVRQPAVPVRIVRIGVETGEPTSGLSLTALVPLILILMTITGAVYPAIDLTAGERERGTLEILVAAPVPRLALLFAKYIAVVTVAMLTATVNLAMMLITLELNGLTTEVFKQTGVTVQLVVELFFLLILFAAFFSAVLLALTSFARSFKEAQAYLIPLMLASLAPGVVGMMPGLRLRGVLAVTPLVNIVLLARDLSERTATVAGACVVVASTLVYAVAAITVAARIFGAEAVLFSEQSAWSDLLRRPAKAAATATVAGALLCLALLFPAGFVADSGISQVPLDARLAYQVLATALLFAGVPLLACLLARIRVVSSLQLALPRWPAWPAALLLAAAAVPVMFHIVALLEAWGLVLFTSQQFRALVRLGAAPSSGPIALAATAALVGMAEEVFFRGFLFSALRSSSGRRVTIVVSAVLFGLFHFVSMIDRLIPSTLMGLLLGWVCWQTRSVLPGMLLHASFNALLILLRHYQTELGGAEGFQEAWYWWQIGALPAAVIGTSLLWRLRLPERPVPASPGDTEQPETLGVAVSRGIADGRRAKI